MARVNVTVPDTLHARARAAGINVSRIAAAALAEELDRLDKIAALDELLAEMTAEGGAPSEQELAAARAWARGIRSTTQSAPRSA
jgi:post-segregation antitoxin (ccd killing protein)